MPWTSVSDSLLTLVPWFVASTCTPGKTAPLASVTFPVNDPYRTWAVAGGVTTSRAERQTRTIGTASKGCGHGQKSLMARDVDIADLLSPNGALGFQALWRFKPRVP